VWSVISSVVSCGIFLLTSNADGSPNQKHNL
jgi:hypothetical protein